MQKQNIQNQMGDDQNVYVNVPQRITGDFSENGCFGRQMKVKTDFKIDELKEAVEQAVYAKFVHGWGGVVEIESDGRDLVLCHFASNNSWIEGHQVVYTIQNYDCFTDFVGDMEYLENGKWKNDIGEILGEKEILDEIDVENIVDMDRIQERLDEIIEEKEMKE